MRPSWASSETKRHALLIQCLVSLESGSDGWCQHEMQQGRQCPARFWEIPKRLLTSLSCLTHCELGGVSVACLCAAAAVHSAAMLMPVCHDPHIPPGACVGTMQLRLAKAAGLPAAGRSRPPGHVWRFMHRHQVQQGSNPGGSRIFEEDCKDDS